MKVKKTLVSVFACVLSLMLLLSFAACQNTNPPAATVESITLEPTTLTLGTGDNERLTAVVTMSDGSTGNVDAWTSSDEAVATVTRGIVTAVTAGTATITAKAGDKEATCAVTVENITVELNKTSLTMDRRAEGEQLIATAKKDGTALEGETFDWTTSDPKVATVDANGFVKPVAEGKATVTATRKGHSQKATCAVEITWDKPVGYNEIAWAEQNKLPSNTWGYWNSKDVNWAQGGLAEDLGVYTDKTFVESTSTLKDGYEYIQMGKITFEYIISASGPNWTYQAFYRSSDNVEGGLLKYNHVYEVTFKMLSSQDGKVTVNPYDDIKPQGDMSEEDYAAYLAEREASGKYNPNHEFEVKAGVEQTITVVFLHDDCGYVYQTGIYDNMGSALHLQLGDFAEEIPVELSVWDFQYKDLGAAENPGVCDESKHAGFVDPDEPVIPEVPELILTPEEIVPTQVKLREDGQKAYFQLYGTIDLTKFDSKDAAKDWLYACYFDLQLAEGGWTLYQFNREVVSLDDDGSFLIEYDITRLAVSTGKGSEAYGGHFARKDPSEAGYGDNKNRDLKLDEEHAVPGESVSVGNKTYTIVNKVGGSDWTSNWGCVAIKVESNGNTNPPAGPVIGIDGDPELPEGGAVTATAADLILENNTVYFVLSGTYTGCSQEEAQAYVDGIYFDFQENGYNNGAWNGSWNEFNTYPRVATANADGTWTIKFDVTATPVHPLPYTGHFKLNDGNNSDNIGTDLKVAGEDGKSVTLGGKKYTLVNKVGSGEVTEAWGCTALKVEKDSTQPPVEPDLGKFEFSGESDAVKNPDKLFYWNDQNWCGSNVTVSQAEIKDGEYTLTYSGATTACWFGMQLFYKNSANVTGNEYTLTLYITASTAGQITVNGQVFDLVAGDNKITVTYVETANASLSIQFGAEKAGTVIEGGTFTFSFNFDEEGGSEIPEIEGIDARWIGSWVAEDKFFDPSAWMTNETKAAEIADDLSAPTLEEDGSLKITGFSRMTGDYMALRNESNQVMNPVHHNALNTALIGQNVVYSMLVKTEGHFGMMLFAGSKISWAPNNQFRAIFVEYNDGHFTFKAEKPDGAVVAEADAKLSAENFTRVDFVFTRISDGQNEGICELRLYVNGKLVTLTGTGTTEDGAMNVIVRGYGQQMEFIALDGKALWIAAPAAEEKPVEKSYEIDCASMTLVEEDGKVWLTVSGTYTGYTEEEFKMDLQYVGGSWPTYATWTKKVELNDGVFTIKYDVTAAEPGEYVAHVFVGDASSDTGFNELPASFGGTATTGTKTYTLGTDEKGWSFKYTVTLKVADSAEKKLTYTDASLEADDSNVWLVLTAEFAYFTEDELKTITYYEGKADGTVKNGMTLTVEKVVVEGNTVKLYFNFTNVDANGEWWWGHWTINGTAKGDVKCTVTASELTLNGKKFKLATDWGMPYVVVTNA